MAVDEARARLWTCRWTMTGGNRKTPPVDGNFSGPTSERCQATAPC